MRTTKSGRLLALSLASLLAAFHPDYSAYSLGTYTLLREIAFAQETGRSFFYPGYILDRTPLFDYKLRLGSMEFLGRDRVWHPYGLFRKINDKNKIVSSHISQNSEKSMG